MQSGLCQYSELQAINMAECFAPYQIRRKELNSNALVPCGKCPACCARRVSNWSFRLMQEDRVSISSHFITLTYAPKHVPKTKNGFRSVCRRDCQLFFKRLRKAHTQGPPIKYYLASEYGNKTRRPHYHLILFNADLNKIAPAWDLGDIYYGTVTGPSVGYTLKYISKDKSAIHHCNDDREREFSLISKGLGKSYLTAAMIKWHQNDITERMYVYQDGKKLGLPRYYKKWIYTERELAWVTNMVKENLQARKMEQIRRALLKNPNYYRDERQREIADFRRRKINLKWLEKL